MTFQLGATSVTTKCLSASQETLHVLILNPLNYDTFHYLYLSYLNTTYFITSYFDTS